MSEQAKATSPTAIEESEPEAGPPQGPEASGAEAGAAEATSETTQEATATGTDVSEGGDASQQAAGTSGDPPTATGEKTETEPTGEAEAVKEDPKTAAEDAEAVGSAKAPAEAAAAETPTDGEATPEPKKATPEPKKQKPEAQDKPAAETRAETPAAVKSETESPEGAEASEAKAAEEKEERPLTEEELARQKEIEGLREAKEKSETVQGRVIGWNQGGFHVVVGTITTFCPRSEMELKNPKSPNYYLDKEFEFYVIKHQKKGKRIVLSRKQLLEEERAKILEDMKTRLVPGKDLEGRVSSITDFGAFVDVGGGIEGLVHVTELSNRRIKHPRDLVEMGQEVKVRVLKVEQDGERISLSMKALEPNPYKEFAEEHPRGSKFQGKVVRKTDFGVFVELLPGIDGMIHVSQLPPGMSLSHESLEVGQEVAGWVIRVEAKRERISLSLKEVPTEDPWKNVGERYSEGSVVEGQVEDIAPFGVFIQLEPGLTGLLPNSEMNIPRGQDRSKHYPPGKKVEIQVASVDPQRKRISLAPQGAAIEGSRSDYKNYLKEQKKQSGEGMTAMAAAFAKLKDQKQDEA